MKLYERMIKLLDYSDKLCKLCIELNTKINNDENIHYDSKVMLITLFKEYNNSMVESLSGFDISTIFDEDIQRQVKHIRDDDSNELFYNIGILCEVLDHIRFQEYGKADAKYFSKKIYDISERIATSASSIKFSDYCYVERGLLKKEEIYPELKVEEVI